MNKKQKQVLVAVICVVVAMLLFPPFHFINSKGIKLNKGYAFLFSPPTLSSGILCSVDVGMLLTQLLVVLVIGGIAFLLTKGSSVNPISSSQQSIVGKSTVDTLYIEQSREKYEGLYEVFLGEKNLVYYLEKFEKFDQQGPGLKPSWNWPSFFVSCPWLLYRKMYGWFFAYSIVSFISGFFFGFLEGAGFPVFGLLLILGPWIAFAIFANSIYHNNVKKKIAAAQLSARNRDQLLEFLRHKGGVNKWVIWGGLLLLVISILASIIIALLTDNEHRKDDAAVKSEMEDKLPDNFIDYRENENKTESKSVLPDNFIDPWDRYSKLDVDKKSDPLNGHFDKKTVDNPNRISDKEPKNESILIQEHYESIKRAHPDFEKYRDNGSLKAWIQKQPGDLSNLLMKTYNDGDSDSVIALLNQFKKDKNNPIFKAPAPYLNSPKKSPDPPKAEELTPARAPAMAGSFITYDNGIILDESTNLMWAAKDNGVNINWQDAKNYCNNYREGGYTDWRMPTQDELAGLCDVSKFQKTECGGSPNHIATDLIHVTCWQVWASEMRDGSAATWKMTEVAYFNFDNCYQSWGMWTNASYRRALPVRSGKKDNNIPIVKVPVPAPSNRGRDSGGSVTYMTKNRIRTPDIGNPSLYPYLPPPVDADQRYREIKAIELKNGKIIEGQILSLNTSTVKIRTTEGKVISYSFEREVQRLIKE